MKKSDTSKSTLSDDFRRRNSFATPTTIILILIAFPMPFHYDEHAKLISEGVYMRQLYTFYNSCSGKFSEKCQEHSEILPWSDWHPVGWNWCIPSCEKKNQKQSNTAAFRTDTVDGGEDSFVSINTVTFGHSVSRSIY